MDSDEDIMYDDEDSDQSSGDDMYFPMETVVVSNSQEAAEDEFPFEILTTEKIAQHMANCIKEVNTVVEISATITRLLLNYFNWDKQKLMDRYYDGDQETLFKEANVVKPFKLSNGSLENSMSVCKSQEAAEDCQICYVTLTVSMLTELECGHSFCTECWNEYLKTKIMEEGIAQTIECAAHSCRVLMDDTSVMKLLKDPKVKLKYQYLITNNFVDCNKLLRWCPTPGCGHVVKVQYLDAKPVTCKCKRTFCFGCGENWHDPVNCTLLKKWLKKCQDSSETERWMAANTKECPKCKAVIEKISGCNYMKCFKCRSAFCWFCLHPWDHDAHTWSNCNRFDNQKVADIKDAQEKVKAILARYLFYNNRYMNHMQSFKFENKLYQLVEEKMKEMQDLNQRWIEVQFLKTAVDTLCSCRQTLMYTYVFAFYLDKNNQTHIFESNQQDLEKSIEILSGYLEREISEENLTEIKQSVQDMYKYCESRRRVLLKHVYEGNDKHWWEYNDL